ncbi:alpha/beta-hydrolase [Marasmius fiardii PR-910]|nr:alpha/beta-hydrolase [Marasmius fiardii PR-910]
MPEPVPDIPYHTGLERDRFREFDFYPSDHPRPRPLLCFVHGGAWRSEDKNDHFLLAQNLVASTGCPVAVPNYRLTPKSVEARSDFRHPEHAQDILEFLNYILTGQSTHSTILFDPSRVYLIGHSCSAHMLSAIILDSSHVTPTLTPTQSLLAAVQGVIMSEGIYDIDKLLEHYPQYHEWFIDAAFGRLASYSDLSVTTYLPRVEHIRWLIIHSKGDTLVDTAQSKTMADHLNASSNPSLVSCSLEELEDEHDDVLKSYLYCKLVANFITL